VKKNELSDVSDVDSDAGSSNSLSHLKSDVWACNWHNGTQDGEVQGGSKI